MNAAIKPTNKPLKIGDLKISSTEKRILMQVRNTPGVSRVDLVDRLGLSKAMLSKAVKKFLGLGLVVEQRESPRDRQVGQPALRLYLDPSRLEFVGLNFSTRGCFATVTDFLGHVKWVSPPHVWQGSLGEVRGLLDAVLVHTHDSAEIGLSIPGLLSAEGQIYEITPNQRHIPFQKIADFLRSTYPAHPLSIGQSDLLFQALRPENFGKVIMYVTLGDGVGGEIFDRNRAFRGGFNQAGNIGGLLPDTGPRPSVQDLADFLGCSIDELTIERLEDMHKSEDPTLKRWIVERAPMLSQPFSAVVQLINPNKIVMGGNFPRRVLTEIVSHISLDVYDLPHRRSLVKPTIEIAETIGEQARAIAAAALPIAHFLNWSNYWSN